MRTTISNFEFPAINCCCSRLKEVLPSWFKAWLCWACRRRSEPDLIVLLAEQDAERVRRAAILGVEPEYVNHLGEVTREPEPIITMEEEDEDEAALSVSVQ